jgi:hypothetical protein
MPTRNVNLTEELDHFVAKKAMPDTSILPVSKFDTGGARLKLRGRRQQEKMLSTGKSTPSSKFPSQHYLINENSP